MKDKLALRRQAHKLKPVVMLGQNGLTDAVLAEIDAALLAHELIKIRINEADKKTRLTLVTTICQQCHAHLIQLIGRILVIYRKKNLLQNKPSYQIARHRCLSRAVLTRYLDDKKRNRLHQIYNSLYCTGFISG
jgi:RNA-binding protein